MAKAMPSRDPVMVLGSAWCREMGIDPNEVLGIDIHLHVGQPAEVTVQLWSPAMHVPEELKRFRIVPIEDEAEVLT